MIGFILLALCAALALVGEAFPPARYIAPTALQAQTPKVTSKPPALPPASPTAAPAPSPSPSPTAEPFPLKTELAPGFFYSPLTEEIKARISGLSYPAPGEDCIISYEELSYISLMYYDFSGVLHADGELIVNAAVAREVAEIFHALYLEKYPFTSITLVDNFGEKADDTASMAANNTSAFNYRLVSGTNSLSKHGYGLAIDINPLYNPYVTLDHISPPEGVAYVDRTMDFPGKLTHEDLAYKLFTSAGWLWGGDWRSPDYQHFYKDPASAGY